MIVKERRLKQENDILGINELAEEIIKENPAVAEDFKKGKEAAQNKILIMFIKVL